VGGEQNPPSWIHILYVLFNYKYYVEFKKGVYMDFYVLTPGCYRNFRSFKPFHAIYGAEHSVAADSGYIPVPPNGKLYIVVSNRRSVTTHIKVSLEVELYKDVGAPTTLITSPGEGAVLNTSTVTVRFGSTSGDVAYYEVSVDGSPYVKVKGHEYVIRGLADGVHTVSVRAVDYSGNEGPAATVHFKVDTTPPEIVLENVADGSLVLKPTLLVTGRLVGGVSLWLNGEKLSLASDGSFKATLNLSPGLNELIFKAVDEAGNTRTLTVRVYYYPSIATRGDIEKLSTQLNESAAAIHKAIEGGFSSLTATLETRAQSIEGALKSVQAGIGGLNTTISKGNEAVLANIQQLSTSIKSQLSTVSERLSSVNSSINTNINKGINRIHGEVAYATAATIVILAVIAVAEGLYIARMSRG